MNSPALSIFILLQSNGDCILVSNCYFFTISFHYILLFIRTFSTFTVRLISVLLCLSLQSHIPPIIYSLPLTLLMGTFLRGRSMHTCIDQLQTSSHSLAHFLASLTTLFPRSSSHVFPVFRTLNVFVILSCFLSLYLYIICHFITHKGSERTTTFTYH